MRTLPTELSAEYLKAARYTKHLFVFEWSTTKRYTDCDQDIYYGGNWYYAKDIKFNSVKLSANPTVDSIPVEIDDVDRAITTIILSESIIDKMALIYAIALDQNLAVQGLPYLLFLGYCDVSSRARGQKRFRIEIYNEMIKWKRKTPRLLCSPTCQWDFKKAADKVTISGTTYTCKLDHVGDTSTNKPGVGSIWSTYWDVSGSGGTTWYEGDWYLSGTCKYAGGEAWCDRSWERCLALSNTAQFDGCRWLPAIQGKEILWGRAPRKT